MLTNFLVKVSFGHQMAPEAKKQVQEDMSDIGTGKVYHVRFNSEKTKLNLLYFDNCSLLFKFLVIYCYNVVGMYSLFCQRF